MPDTMVVADTIGKLATFRGTHHFHNKNPFFIQIDNVHFIKITRNHLREKI